MNQNAQQALLLYQEYFSAVSPQDYLFPGKGHADIPLSRSQAVLMEIYNHSSFEITKRYLGIEQDDKDSVFLEINL